MSELRQLFFETAAELVQKLNDEAMRLEKAPGDAETARSLRRTVHTLKGDSAACGFRELSELCHEFEDVLTLGNTAAAASVPEIALRAADVFAALLEAYQKGTKLPSIQSLRADIARLAHPATAGGRGKSKAQEKEGGGENGPSAGRSTSNWRSPARWRRASAFITWSWRSTRSAHAHCRASDDPVGACRTGRSAGSLSGRRQSRSHQTQIEAALVSEKPAEQIRDEVQHPHHCAERAKVTPVARPAPVASAPANHRLPLKPF
jgi:chemotaxis protein histidine kinase CheA